MVTLGGVLALYSAATYLLGPDVRRFPPAVLGNDAYVVAGIRITAAQVLILGGDRGAGGGAAGAAAGIAAGAGDPGDGGAAGGGGADGD